MGSVLPRADTDRTSIAGRLPGRPHRAHPQQGRDRGQADVEPDARLPRRAAPEALQISGPTRKEGLRGSGQGGARSHPASIPPTRLASQVQQRRASSSESQETRNPGDHSLEPLARSEPAWSETHKRTAPARYQKECPDGLYAKVLP